jgi:hypothetical protein
MATFIAKTATISVSGVDLTDHASSVVVEGTGDEVDVSTFRASGSEYRSWLVGLRDATITVTWFQDFAAGEVDATLFPLWGSNTPFVVFTKPTDAAISATNPAYTLTAAIMPNYSPLNASIGEASSTETVFRCAPGGILDRDVTP